MKNDKQQLAKETQTHNLLEGNHNSAQEELSKKELIITQLQEEINFLKSQQSSSEKKIQIETITEVELKSKKGIDYTKLLNCL